MSDTSTTIDGSDADQPSTEELVQRIEALEEGQQELRQGAIDAQGRNWSVSDFLSMGLTRRQALTAIAAIAGGATAGGAMMQAVTPAAADPGDNGRTTIGTSNNRFDAWLGEADAEKVSTDQLSTGEDNRTLVVGPESYQYDTISAGISAAGTEDDILVLPTSTQPDYDETVDVSPIGQTKLKAHGGQGTVSVFGSGDHTFTLDGNDNYIQGFWVNQEDDTGDFDAIHVTEREARIRDVGIDAAPRYGLALTNDADSAARAAIVSDCEITGGDVAGLYMGPSVFAATVSNLVMQGQVGDDAILVEQANDCTIDATIQDPFGNGLRTIGGNGNRFDVTIRQPSGHGAVLDRNNSGHFHIRGAGDQGMRIEGLKNSVHVWIRNPTNEGLVVDGDNNVIHGFIDGDVTLTANSSDNVISGRVGGSLTDNGTGNDTSGVL